MFQRELLKVLESRISEPRRYIHVLAGPRQTGKTTLVTQLTKKLTIPYVYVSADALAGADNWWIDQQWEIARQRIKKENANDGVLIIDEIQTIGEWSEAVKKNWDNDTFTGVGLKVILLGSARLLLDKGLNESLAGRFELFYVDHWKFSEMRDAFGLTAEEYVWYGGYPGAVALQNDFNRWRNYVLLSLIEPSISRLMLTRIEKPAILKRLFELGCTYSGQIVSFNKQIGQLKDAGNTTTLAHYADLLDSAGLLGYIEKFYKEKIRQKGSIPKWQVCNNALFSVYTGLSFEDARNDLTHWGRQVESAIGAHLINSCRNTPIKLYYWRERDFEVDFVLEKGDKLIGIEVKTGFQGNTAGMGFFQKHYKPFKVLLVGRTGIPWEEFLTYSPEELF